MLPYRTLQRYAFGISVLSVLYNGAEAGFSLGFGSESSSRSLIFFGIQSGIEVISSCIVVWRFRYVTKPGEEDSIIISESDLRIEKFGTWAIAMLLAILTLATEITAIVDLALHIEPDTSTPSLIIAATTLVIMIFMWLPKRYLAHALNSSTMRGEATCSLSCIQNSIVLFVGSLIFRLWKGGWWVDSATSIFLGLLFGYEAQKMIRWVRDPEFNGGCCGHHKRPRLATDAELAEEYRDLCHCCLEKEECKTSDECKRDPNSEESHCKPIVDAGTKCCTHKLIRGVRPLAQTDAGHDDGHCTDHACTTARSTGSSHQNSHSLSHK